MRIKIGQVVRVDKDVNLGELKPLDRIISAATNAYYNTALYKRRFAETEEKREEQRRRIKESLIDNILRVIYDQLENNILLKEKNDICVAIILQIPPRFSVHLVDVLDAHEFDSYVFKVIKPSKLLSKFCKPPTLLYVSERGGLLND